MYGCIPYDYNRVMVCMFQPLVGCGSGTARKGVKNFDVIGQAQITVAVSDRKKPDQTVLCNLRIMALERSAV